METVVHSTVSDRCLFMLVTHCSLCCQYISHGCILSRLACRHPTCHGEITHQEPKHGRNHVLLQANMALTEVNGRPRSATLCCLSDFEKPNLAVCVCVSVRVCA